MSKTLSIDFNILRQYNSTSSENNSIESDVALNILCVVLSDLGFEPERQGYILNQQDMTRSIMLKELLTESVKGIPPCSLVKVTHIRLTRYLLNFVY